MVRLWGTSEGSLALTSEAVWGMLAFATLPVLMSGGALWGAWEARYADPVPPWATLDARAIGGDS